MSEIRLGDIGTKFLATVLDQDNAVVDISSATTLQIIFEKPGGTIVTQTATLETDGTDGKMYYTTVSGDLDELGKWEYQGRVQLSANEDWKTTIGCFTVHKNL